MGRCKTNEQKDPLYRLPSRRRRCNPPWLPNPDASGLVVSLPAP